MIRPSLPNLLEIKPIPISSIKSSKLQLRLPPSSSTTTSASTSTSSYSKPSSKYQTPVLDNLLAYQKQCIQAEQNGLTSRDGHQRWPRNLRLERQVNNKNLYWKVPKEQRDILRKSLKEA